MRNHVAKITDKNGKVWLFEGFLKGEPIWVDESEAVPVPMEKKDALMVSMSCCKETDKPGCQMLKG